MALQRDLYNRISDGRGGGGGAPSLHPTGTDRVKHRLLRIVFGWRTVWSNKFHELELITWPVIINDFGICFMFVCLVSLSQPSNRVFLT